MHSYFRGIAVDYDGTLTDAGRPPDEVLDALRDVRSRGRKLVLVTGRIVEELRAVFPECADHFDLIVGENGAVIAAGSLVMPIGPVVPRELDAGLRARGIPFRRGEVILATQADHEHAILDEVNRRGLDCQLVRNRGELMVVPAGVSKASGVRHALQRLRVSTHSAIAIGDAENDLAMLEACEIGVAVANALDSVKKTADVVLGEPNGVGVASFLREAVLGGVARLRPRRWQVPLGWAPDGTPVQLPASQIDIVVAGGSGSGKSFATGLVAEQLVRLGYVVCVLDPEGDHVPLADLPSVVTLGGRDHLPAVEDVARVFEQTGTSVVVDLALVTAKLRDQWTHDALRFLDRRRAETGVPHWLIIDEAHTPLGETRGEDCFDHRQKGHCIVTYQPERLAGLVTEDIDYALLVAGAPGVDPESARVVCDITGVAMDALSRHADAIGLGEALLVRGGSRPEVQRFRFAPRWVPHVRHWHKYSSAELPGEQGFHFRAPTGTTGVVARNMEQFHGALRRAPLEVVRHHARLGDFSRWVTDVFRDETLASALLLSERRVTQSASDEAAEAARREILAAIEMRYGSFAS